MLSLTVSTKKSPEEIEKRLATFFGAGGLGLKESREGDALQYVGSDGHVLARVQRDEDANRTTIDFQTREYENDVKQFAREVG